jgi:formiminotetrahydrofolate cyclodeaminase
MVGSLTTGKKKYAGVEDEIRRLMRQAEELRERLLLAVEQDAAAFAPLARAYGMPVNTDAQRAEKQRVMERALHDAAQAPMAIMELCVETLEVTGRMAEIGSALAVSDAGCAAACCGAALNAACLNVWINTRSMKDRACASRMNERAGAMLRDGTARWEGIYAMVRAQLEV